MSQVPKPTKPVPLSDWLKPHPHEAVLRIRYSVIGLISTVLLTSLLPLPSPMTALVAVMFRDNVKHSWWFYACALELTFISSLLLNILQAVYSIKYPHTPLPPLPSPKHGMQKPAPTPQRRLAGLSPHTSPQQQKVFSSSYASSPVSTPSRILQYSIPSPSSPFNASLNSSVSLPASPSPILSSPLAAYRGRHSLSVGRALDGSFLNQLTADDSDADD